jgi:hypothetical protein
MPRFFAFLGLLAITHPLRADFFNEKVRPILSNYCFKCHGPDERTRKGELRLDRREDAIRPASSGEMAINPANLESSELLVRINSKDADSVMPPPSTKIQLSTADKENLEKWIRNGAEYSDHWAFVSPQRPPVPNIDSKWARNGIDAFIYKKLQEQGLTPSNDADRKTWIRRVSLDLVGLPPTAAEVNDYLNDTSPNADEKLVDRLLASPRNGERWARKWLDLARYADTNGYEKDRPRSIWPYRDWVIQAINSDMPFDQFTIEQLAGDLLADATQSQRIATGFHRNTMLNEEGGIDPLEFRFHAMTDRVATTGIVWLGLTVGCAQCHTHKYDPITHEDYYRLFAYLNNADEVDLAVETSETTRSKRAIEKQIQDKLKALLADPTMKASFNAWKQEELQKLKQWHRLPIQRMESNTPILEMESNDVIFVSGDTTKFDHYRIQIPPIAGPITAIRIEVFPDPRLPNQGPGRTYYEGPFGDFTLTDLKLIQGNHIIPFASAKHTFASGGFTSEKAIDANLQTGWSISGGQGQTHQAIFLLKQPTRISESTNLEMQFERHYASGLGKFRITYSTASKPEFTANLTPEQAIELGQQSDEHTEVFRAYLRSDLKQKTMDESISSLERQRPKPATTLVFQERAKEHPRTTHLYNRGEYLQPKQEIIATLPGYFSNSKGPNPRNRLDFARWLVSKENPLTARVTVNRAWASFFGQGLVRTLQDFGYQGESPSHPELLDYLSLQLIDSNWSMKKLHRTIVLSATYRQESTVTADRLAKDPSNRFLSRGPKFRVDAEILRDSALLAAGLLSESMYGASVFPPQPNGVSTEGTYGQLVWKTSTGSDRYRRSLYTFSKRTSPFAQTVTFDGPTGEVCLAKRDVSNTPLQALTMLNDPVFMEAAQTLGKSFATTSGSVDERIGLLFQRILTRTPDANEVVVLKKFLQLQQQRNPAAEPSLAWTLLARAILNLDEFIARR